MALAKGVNSYVSLNEANTYFADRLNASAWGALTDPVKEQALVSATSILDENNWTGTALYEDQDLAFPRMGEYFDPRLGASVIMTDSVPKRVTDAVCEFAVYIQQNPEVYNPAGTVRDVEIGSIKLTNVMAAPAVPSIVKKLIKPLLVNSGSRLWWRNN